MIITLIYHKNPYTVEPRGGELSVRAIVEYLKGKGHEVRFSNVPYNGVIMGADLVLTWGRPALAVADVCKAHGIPLALMVRFWRNISPLPAGNLMTRKVDDRFASRQKPLFETASAVITNTEYSKKVIERWHPSAKGKTHVSYVPIMGEFEQSGDNDGYLTIVTPEIYGELRLLQNLSHLMPNEKFLVVNASPHMQELLSQIRNVTVCGYMDMDEVWRQTKALLVPVYYNDICGTRRSTVEALRNGVPVVALDRCGMSEKIPEQMLVGHDASWSAWVDKINDINRNYNYFKSIAKRTWEKYDTLKQLEGFEKILLSCVS